MKNKIKFAAITGGVLAGLASFIPLTSYAIANPSDVTITATVNPAISLDAASGFTVQGNAGEIMTGYISTTVKANTKYTIGFKVADSYYAAKNTTAMTATGINDTIPAGAGVARNTSAWGIKAKTNVGDTANADTYTEITTSNQTLFQSTSNNDGTTPIKFEVGISTLPNITAGSYSVDLTVTAAAQ